MNLVNGVIQFFKGVYCELTKVVWFGKKEVFGVTVVVVIFVIMASIFVSIADLFFGMIVSRIL
jgi:preprotein translocase subunit SecE